MADSAADVARVNDDSVYQWGSSGKFAALDALVDRSLKRDDYFPPEWRDMLVDGKLYTTQPHFGVNLLVYNTGLFQKAGVTAPTEWSKTWDWATFVANARKLATPNASPGQEVFAMTFPANYVIPPVWGNGGRQYAADETRCAFNSQEAEATEGHEGFVEATIHCDVFVFKEIYGGGSGPDAGPYPRAILDAPASEGQQQLEEYFRVLWRRAIVAMHTFSPDRADMQGWMDKLLDTLQQFPMEMARYARIAAEWDPVKVKRYLEDTHFYDRDDPLIRCARGIQRGAAAPPRTWSPPRRRRTSSSSRYARALSKGLSYVVVAGRLYAGEIDVATAKTRFDVGVPELTLAYTGPGAAVGAGDR